jgi:hypothetical protein
MPLQQAADKLALGTTVMKKVGTLLEAHAGMLVRCWRVCRMELW